MYMRTAAELIIASQHLHYEFGMLNGMATAMVSGISDKTLQSAILESFGIHLRNMIDFFYLPRSPHDDILAQDFFEKPEVWPDIRPTCSAELIRAKKRADKELSHLTFTRCGKTENEKL